MFLSFGEPSYVTSLDRVSFVGRRQALASLELCRAPETDYDDVDDRLAGLDLRWFVVCDERGTPVADFWEAPGMVIVFRAATTEVVGQVTEERFLCNDVAMWTAVATAHDAPKGLDVAAESAERLEDEEYADDALERSAVQLVAAIGKVA
jgi:hypothetical protein